MAIPIEKVEQIPILFEKLGTKAAVARELGISPATVTRYLELPIEQKSVIKKKKEKIDVRKLSEDEKQKLIQKINEEYQSCYNMSEVSRRMGVSVGYIKKHLNEESLEKAKEKYEERDALWFYIVRLFNRMENIEEPVSTRNIVLMNNFFKKGMPYKGQLLTLKYFFEVKKSPIEKANGSIGIIPYVYEESRAYYSKLVAERERINADIKRQLEIDRVEIPFKPSDYTQTGRRKKKLIDLNTIQ